MLYVETLLGLAYDSQSNLHLKARIVFRANNARSKVQPHKLYGHEDGEQNY